MRMLLLYLLTSFHVPSCTNVQIRGIVEAYGCEKVQFRRKWDHIKRYMKENKIPKEVCIEKVHAG